MNSPTKHHCTLLNISIIFLICWGMHSPVLGQSEQVRLLTNPDGWVMVNRLTTTPDGQIEDIISNLSPCMQSAILTFKSNGTFTQVFPIKNCEDQIIEDTYGTWTSSMVSGVLKIQTKDLVNVHDWRTYFILTLTEQNLITSDRAPGTSGAETWVFRSQQNSDMGKEDIQEEDIVYSDESINYEDHVDPSRFFTNEEQAKANTAANSNYMNQQERDVIYYCNLARMFPVKFKTFLQDYMARQPEYIRNSFLSDQVYYGSLLTELSKMKPLPPLYPDKAMYDQAKCWADESGELGLYGHDRANCKEGYWGENCSYGEKHAHNVVFALLIDFDVPSKGHRANIFREIHRGIGVASAPHKEYGTCTVLDFGISTDWEKENGLLNKKKFYEILKQNWTEAEIRQADACRALPFLNDYEKDFLFYANLMRTTPQKFRQFLWTSNPLFQPILLDEEEQVTFKAQYSAITNWLAESKPLTPVVPEYNSVKERRCMARKWEERADNPQGCLTRGYAWSVSSGLLGEDAFNNVMNSFAINTSFPYALESDDLLLISQDAGQLTTTEILFY